MQRGILNLTNTETSVLLNSLNLGNYSNTPLGNKLSSINLQNNEVEILLSIDELETIIDEIGFVEKNSNPALYSSMSKITELMGNLRE